MQQNLTAQTRLWQKPAARARVAAQMRTQRPARARAARGKTKPSGGGK
jgi:hypothetical protein